MNKPKKNQQIWQKVRKLVNDLHLWGGLISGIVVFIVCITGTIYVYNTEIREAASSEYYKVQADGNKIPPDSLVAMVKPSVKGRIVGIKISHAADATTAILFNNPSKEKQEGSERGLGAGDKGKRGETAKDIHSYGHSAGKDKSREGSEERLKIATAKGSAGGPQAGGGGGRRPRFNQMMVNPYSGELIGDVSEVKTKTAEFMQKMFGLHRWLLLNEIEEPIIEGVENRKLGSWITGTATLLFLFGVISGIIIWFPNKIRSWKNGLRIKWSAKWKRVNHDIHNTLGFYSCIILFLMAITGPFWSFDWYRAGWQKTWGTYQSQDAPREEKSKRLSVVPSAGDKPLSIAATIIAVNAVLPYEGDVTLNFALDSTGTISVSKNRIGFFAPSAGDKLTLDQYTGEVLEKNIFREKPFNERAAASIKALHIGDIYGPFTKLIYFISCLIATSLPVTGVMIWINKMKKKTKKKVIKL